MSLSALLELPSPPALGRANDRIRLSNERRTANHALTLNTRMRFAIDGLTLGVPRA
jgi:hypothetical protein